MRLQYTFQLRHNASVEIPVVLELSSVSLHHGAIAQRLHVVSTAAMKKKHCHVSDDILICSMACSTAMYQMLFLSQTSTA